MKATDKEKLDLLGAMLPVMKEIRRFYKLQCKENQRALDMIKDPECFKDFLQFTMKETEKTSRRLNGLVSVCWALIDEVCKSLGVAYYAFTEGINDGETEGGETREGLPSTEEGSQTET